MKSLMFRSILKPKMGISKANPNERRVAKWSNEGAGDRGGKDEKLLVEHQSYILQVQFNEGGMVGGFDPTITRARGYEFDAYTDTANGGRQ